MRIPRSGAPREPQVTLEVDESAAFVLYDLLGRWVFRNEPLELRDDGEAIALQRLMAALERNVVRSVKSDYDNVIKRAKAQLKKW